MLRNRLLAGTFAFLCTVLSSSVPVGKVYAQGTDAPSSSASDIPAVRLPASAGKRESTVSIMQRQAAAPPPTRSHPDHELEYPDRAGLPQSPGAPAVSQLPGKMPEAPIAAPSSRNIHTTSFSFDGATLTDTGAFPPDSMGTVGPAQFITFVNGRIRSFTKAGAADGVINADPDVFFAPVMTPVGGTVVLNFTSDPQIRYDRFTARWYMSIIDVPCTNATCTTTAANRWLLAVSDATSAGVITGATVWTLFQVQADPGTNFCDYPSLGVDVNALYFGCNMFSSAGSFVGTNGYVVQKASVQGAGPMVVSMFANLAAGAGAGPYSPRGVDNFDPSATEGYFVGVDNAAFSLVQFRRVGNPGSLTPTISANIGVTVATTTTPNPVTHLGNTGGNNGRLDSLDDRIYAAMIRNGRLWTAHNFRVSAAGVANTAATSRNGTRWYEFQNLTTTPTIVQSGTVFDNAATLAAARQYWIPTVTVTGQGHSVLGISMAGTPIGATPVYVGRLSGDTLGTMSGPPTVAAVSFGTTTANYNPPSDPGGASGRRWGDYSFTAVDPLDDMSVWTIQEYNQALNSYAVRVGHLQAPPPATPTCSGSPINFNAGSGNVVINATSTGGSGFYDPGANLPPPALPFSHLSALMSNGTVNSATFNSPTQVTLNITAGTGGLQSVTITNPDGQNVTANGCINVIGGTATKLKFTTQPVNGTAGVALPAVAVSVEDASGNVITTDNTTQISLALSSNTLNGTLTQTAVNGVATFSNLSINTAATGYTLTATSSPVLTPDTSSAFDIVAAAANKLVFAQQPSDAVAGAAISPAITVQVQDQFGNLAATDISAVTLALGSNPGSSTLSGTSTQNAVAGVATFNDLSLNKVGTGYTLAATDGALTGATSNAFNITPAAVASIAFGVQPSNTTAGVAIAPAVTVQLLDAFGNLASTDNSSQVSIAVASGPGTVSGGAAVTVSGGVATFANLVITTTGTYTLGATSGAFTATSSSFVVGPAAGNQLVFVQQPSNTVAGQSIAPAVTVQLQDQFGNALTTSGVTVSLAANGPGTIVSGNSANTVNGVATFNAVVIQTAGSYTLSASAAGFASAISNAFVISPATASKVVYTQPPTNAVAGQAIAPAITVAIEDAFNNVVTSSSAQVALAIGTNPGGAGTVLSGGGATAAVNGVATFAAVSINKTGNGYTLVASSTGLTSATSATFNISAGAASKLVFTTQPALNANVVAGAAINLVAQVQDANSNVVTTDTSAVTISIGTNPGSSTLGGTTTTNAVAGVATFTGLGLSLNKIGTGYTLLASDSNIAVANATSNAFNIVPAAASALAFVQQPSDIAAGATMTPAVTVQVQDAFGNRLTSSVNVVTLSIATGPAATLFGGGALNDSAGLVTYNALSVHTVGTYTLSATSTGLTAASSGSFNVTPGALHHLTFTTQPPASVVAGSSFGVDVQLQDQFNNVLTGDSGTTVSLALGANPGGDGFAGASTTDTAGAASFSGISLTKAASGYTLVATASSKTGTSSTFTVTPAAFDHLAVSTQPPATAIAGTSFNVAAQLRDQFNNVLTGDNSSSVSVALSANPGGDPYAGGSSQAAAGVATFSATLTHIASGYQLTFTSGVATASSNTFDVVPNSGVLLAFVQQPADVLQGTRLGSVSVEIRDAFGNRASADSSTVVSLNVSACGGPIAIGSATVSNGLATFAAPASTFDFYTVTGQGLQLQAAASSLTSASSQMFNVTSNTDIQFANGFEGCRP